MFEIELGKKNNSMTVSVWAISGYARKNLRFCEGVVLMQRMPIGCVTSYEGNSDIFKNITYIHH